MAEKRKKAKRHYSAAALKEMKARGRALARKYNPKKRHRK